MAKNIGSISEAELEIMKILWQKKKHMNSSEILAELTDKTWKITTVSTLLSRLTEKKAVTYEKKGKFYYYEPVLKEDDYKISQTKSLLGRIYGGSVKNLVATLYENEEMSEQDIKELRDLFLARAEE